MTPRPLPLGVVGVGSLGHHHARLLCGIGGARLVGVFDSDAARARSVAESLGTRDYDDLDALLDDVAAVTVAVPAHSHHDAGRAALTRGRHVLMEKPLATSVAEAEDLVGEAARRGVLLQAGHVERFNPAVLEAAPHLRAPRRIESERFVPSRRRGTDVSVTFDLMIHDLDLLRLIVGEPFPVVRAVGGRDAVEASLVSESGVTGVLRAARGTDVASRRMRVELCDCEWSLDLLARRGSSSAAGGGAGGGRSDGRESRGQEPLRLELEAFVEAVRSGGPAAVDGREGLEAVRLAERVDAAVAAGGGPVPG